MPAARFPPARAAQLLAYLALANAATAAASWLVLEDERERSTDPSYWTVDENYDFKGETRLLSEPDFQRIFRLSRTGFDEVLGRIEHDVVTGNRCNSRRAGPIPADVKLAVTLRFLAGGQPYDIAKLYGVGGPSSATAICGAVRWALGAVLCWSPGGSVF